jgi:hypothetical protein
VSFDGYYSSTYKNYKVICSYVTPVTDGAYLYLRYRRSNADITSSSYRYSNHSGLNNTADGSSSVANGAYNSAKINLTVYDTDSTESGGGVNVEIKIYNPLNTSAHKFVVYQSGHHTSDNSSWSATNGTGVLRDAVTALSGLTIYFNTGNIASGNFKLYGIK